MPQLNISKEPFKVDFGQIIHARYDDFIRQQINIKIAAIKFAINR